MKNEGIIKGAFLLGAGALFSKILGAVYRIFLTLLVGGYGLGLYQMIFPLYTLLLDFSGSGVPSALSKIISGKNEVDRKALSKQYLLVAIRILSVFGLIFTILMAILSRVISKAQGNLEVAISYVFLSPSVFLVAIISCFRGYFQGQMNMKPTAISQIIEQSVKLVLGLFFAYLFRGNVANAVAGATGAITVSELIALIYLYMLYKKDSNGIIIDKSAIKSDFSIKAKEILKVTFPITIVGIMLPISHVIDSFVVVNVLSTHTQSATALYGLLGGVVCTIIGLPVSICYGISTATIPSVSASKTLEQKKENATNSILLTTAIAFPFYILTFIFAPLVVGLLFSSLSLAEKNVTISLLRLTAPCVMLLSLVQTTNAVLIGSGKFYIPVISMASGVLIKTALGIILMLNPKLSVMGGGIALIACYFFICLINLIVINVKGKTSESSIAYRRQYSS